MYVKMTCVDTAEGEKEIFLYFLFHLLVLCPVWTMEVMEFELTFRSKLRHLNLDTKTRVH